MSTDPTPGRRAGHEDHQEYVDKDVSGAEPAEREGDYVDRDVERDVPAVERTGEFTDRDVDEGDKDAGTGGYTRRDDG